MKRSVRTLWIFVVTVQLYHFSRVLRVKTHIRSAPSRRTCASVDHALLFISYSNKLEELKTLGDYQGTLQYITAVAMTLNRWIMMRSSDYQGTLQYITAVAMTLNRWIMMRSSDYQGTLQYITAVAMTLNRWIMMRSSDYQGTLQYITAVAMTLNRWIMMRSERTSSFISQEKSPFARLRPFGIRPQCALATIMLCDTRLPNGTFCTSSFAHERSLLLVIL